MNNELFDKIIHDNLAKNQVVPSSKMHKSFGKRLFFQNLVVFHKFKILAALLMLSSVSYFTYSYLNGKDVNSDLVQNNNTNAALFGVDFVSKDKTSNSQGASNEQNEDLVSYTNSAAKTEAVNPQNNESNSIIATSNKTDASNTTNNKVFNSITKNKNIANSNSKVNSNTKDANLSKNKVNFESAETDSKLKNVVESNSDQISLFKAESKSFQFNSDLSLVSPVNVETSNMPFKNRKILRREFSVDAYTGLYAHNSITNHIENEDYNKYHWDFYQNTQALKTSQLGGLSANYAVGTKFFKVKAKVGVNFSKIREEKAVYEFQEVTDPAWLDVFEVNELSWVNTYGEDTCKQCMFASNSQEFQDNFAKSHNEYSYINVPLQLGGEFNFKYVTLDLMAGLQWSHLRQTSGLYVKEEKPSDSQFYFWNDLIITSMNNEQNMLRTNHFSWLVNANLRIRVTRQFDIMAGYQMGASLKGITNDAYFINKNHQFSNFNLGITFYPNRLPLSK